MRARSPAPRLAVLALALLGPTVFGVTVAAAAKHHPPARMLVYAQE
jgi:hypothetical protein